MEKLSFKLWISSPFPGDVVCNKVCMYISVTIRMKTIEQYFHVVPIIMLCKVALWIEPLVQADL